MEKLEMELI